jgi:1-phosphofructokinase family hexose kinase
MIVTLTLNPALDRSAEAACMRPGEIVRITDVHDAPGGKGVNVSRVLHALGTETLAVFLSGGAAGETHQELLRIRGIPFEAVPMHGETRTNLAIREKRSGREWKLNFPGSPISPRDWQRMTDVLESLASRDNALVLSGSLPPGCPKGGYGWLLQEIAPRFAWAALDTDAPYFPAPGECPKPRFVKPNLDEVRHILGLSAFHLHGWKKLLKRLVPYAETPLLTLGVKGAAAIDEHGEPVFYQALRVKDAHSAGAGDAFLAGYLHAAVNGKPVAEALEAGCETAGKWLRREFE